MLFVAHLFSFRASGCRVLGCRGFGLRSSGFRGLGLQAESVPSLLGFRV